MCADILRRPRNRRSSKNRRLSAQQLASGMSSNRSSVSASTFLSPNASPLHTSIRSSNRMTSKEEEKESRKQDNDSRATCSGCGDYLPFILKGKKQRKRTLYLNLVERTTIIIITCTTLVIVCISINKFSLKTIFSITDHVSAT